MKQGYRQSHADPCVYIRSEVGKIAIVTIWVDDLLLFADSEETMEEMKKDIHTEWETTDMGEPTKIIGIKITQSLGQISISQGKSIENILKQQGLINANPAKMPLDPHIKIEPNPDGNEGNRSNVYAQLIGELQFIVNSTWPNITYAINRLASYTVNLSM